MNATPIGWALTQRPVEGQRMMAVKSGTGSSALVAVNALLLKRTKLEGVTRRSPDEPSLPGIREVQV